MMVKIIERRETEAVKGPRLLCLDMAAPLLLIVVCLVERWWLGALGAWLCTPLPLLFDDLAGKKDEERNRSNSPL